MRGRRLRWVKRRNARCEQMSSAHLPIADIRQGMSKTYRSVLTMPACRRTSAIGLVLPAVSGTLFSPTRSWSSPDRAPR